MIPQVDERATEFRTHHHRARLRTRRRCEFVDVTERVADEVRRSGVLHGQVAVHTRHTTAAIVVNEHEPGLFEDVRELLDRLAPLEARYRHDDFERRTVNLTPDERANGHAHLRSLLLGCSETLAVIDGRVELGRWQRIFLVELDGPRRRELVVSVAGTR